MGQQCRDEYSKRGEAGQLAWGDSCRSKTDGCWGGALGSGGMQPNDDGSAEEKAVLLLLEGGF